MSARVLWKGLHVSGYDLADLRQVRHGWHLSGIALLAHDHGPCRVDYDIECDSTWATRRARIGGHDNGAPLALELVRSEQGTWMANETHIPALDGCLDVDLQFTPATNLLPIRRLHLAVGSQAPVRAAWVRFPALSVEPLDQTYRRLDEATYRYESGGGTFRRDLTVDATGFVLEYPGFWTADRVWS